MFEDLVPLIENFKVDVIMPRDTTQVVTTDCSSTHTHAWHPLETHAARDEMLLRLFGELGPDWPAIRARMLADGHAASTTETLRRRVMFLRHPNAVFHTDVAVNTRG
jgi:hypothetical protein